MTTHFFGDRDPPAELLDQLASAAPTNPFYTKAYLAAKQDLGLRVWVVGVRQPAGLLAACPVLVRQGRWSRSLEIDSLPVLPYPDLFWEGFIPFCRKQRFADGELGTFASAPMTIPPLPGETGRQTRCEHVLFLKEKDFLKKVSSNHKRNVKRGQKAGLTLRVTDDPSLCRDHVRLMGQSLERRQERGESVTGDLDTAESEAYLRRAAGQLFQAMAGDTVQSSMLVLLAARGAYYHSAGSSPEGMACGASPWLVHETARTLQERGLEVFNLGGATETNPGLFRFKTDFGTTPVPLQAVTLYLGSTFWKTCKATLRALRARLWR